MAAHKIKKIKNMKKYIILSLLILATTVVSRAQSGNIVLSGTVANVTTITVTSVAGYNSLPIAAGCVDQAVATIVEKSNDKIGYTVTLNSANAGSTAQAALKAAGNSDVINYSMKYNGAA